MSRLHALVVALLVPLAVGATSVAAGASAEPATRGVGAAVVSLVSRSGWLAPGGDLELRVRLGAVPPEATLVVTVHERARTDAALQRALRGEIPGATVFRSDAIPVSLVPPDARGARTLRLGTTPLPPSRGRAVLRVAGVYPVAVTVVASGEVLGRVTTPVVRTAAAADAGDTRPRLGVVADVSAPTGADGDGQLPASALSRLTRLTTALAQARLPTTLAGVPDTLVALTATAGSEPAIQAVRALAAAGEALALPAVPVAADDLVASGLGGLLPSLLDRGVAETAAVVGVRPHARIWPAWAGIGEAGLGAVGEAGYGAVLIDAERAGFSEEPPPGAPAPLRGHDLSALVADRALANLLGSSASHPDPWVDAARLVLATGALDAPTEDEPAGRAHVVRLRDLADDALARSVLPLLADPASAIVPVTLTDLLRQVGPGTVAARAVAPPPVDLEPAPGLVPPLLRRLGSAEAMVGAAAADDPTLAAARVRVGVAVAADVPTDRRAAALDAAGADLDRLFGAVSLTGQTTLNLTSRQGTLPLTIRNDTRRAVTVLVRLRSDRIRFRDGGDLTVDVTEDHLRLDVPVEALATGSVPVRVTLLTPDGAEVLARRRLNVRSTAISGVGLVLSLGALVVLVVWWARSWRRSAGDRPARGRHERAGPVPPGPVD